MITSQKVGWESQRTQHPNKAVIKGVTDRDTDKQIAYKSTFRRKDLEIRVEVRLPHNQHILKSQALQSDQNTLTEWTDTLSVLFLIKRTDMAELAVVACTLALWTCTHCPHVHLLHLFDFPSASISVKKCVLSFSPFASGTTVLLKETPRLEGQILRCLVHGSKTKKNSP